MTAAIFSTLRRRRRHNQHRRTKRDKLTRLYDDGEEDKRLGLLLPVIALGMLKYMSVNIIYNQVCLNSHYSLYIICISLYSL